MANKVEVNIKLQILKSVSVVKDITVFAKSRKIDLVVMGSHGRTGLDKAIPWKRCKWSYTKNSVSCAFNKINEIRFS